MSQLLVPAGLGTSGIFNPSSSGPELKNSLWTTVHKDCNFTGGPPPRCKVCNKGNGRRTNKTHDHGIDGTHYVCETHNYVGTSQLH